MSHGFAFQLPLRTYGNSHMSGREHWAARSRRVKNERLAAYGWTRAAMNGAHWSSVVVRLIRVSPRFLDDDNLRPAVKGVRDGIADAFGVDDRDPRVTWEYGQERGRPKEYGVRVEVEIR